MTEVDPTNKIAKIFVWLAWIIGLALLMFVFQDVLDDVSKFIRENTEEVIIFAVQGDGGSGQLSAAKSAAKTTLSGYLTDSITGTETLESLVSSDKNIIYAQNHCKLR